MILQQAPAGDWVATAKIAHADVDTDGEAAGLALVNRLNPNYFVKTALQYKSDASPESGQPARQVGGAGGHLERQRGHDPARHRSVSELGAAEPHGRLRVGPVRP